MINSLRNNFKLKKIVGIPFLIPLHQPPTQIFLLNKTADFIWSNLEKGKTVNWCIDYLSDKFRIDKQVIAADFDKFTRKLTKKLANNPVELTKLIDKFSKVNIPLEGSIELTGQCNLNCIHCYARGERVKPELSYSAIKNIIGQLSKNGCLFLHLTGGECLARKDFQKIYLLVRKVGIIPIISTNATLFNDNLINLLKLYPPLRIKVSLYGAEPTTHDRITGIKGSFNKTMTNIKNLEANGLTVILSAIIFKSNYPEVIKMKKMAREMKIPIIFYTKLLPTLEKNAVHLHQCISDNECRRIRAINQKSPDFIKRDPPLKRLFNEKVFPCNAGLKSFHIDCQGKLYLCKMERGTGFSLTDFSFIKCWQKLKKLRLNKLALPEKCLPCNRKSSCNICPPIIRLYNDNFTCANSVKSN
jgi:radical SAM protein with 4Fe4S-binding SPASM domain